MLVCLCVRDAHGAREADHALRGAIVEALRCKMQGKSQPMFFNLCGHGPIDMQAYIDYQAGKRADSLAAAVERAQALVSRLSVLA
jgi:tryptophan synthase beta chain